MLWVLQGSLGCEEEEEEEAMESSVKQVVVEEPLVSPCDMQQGDTFTLGMSL